MSEALNQIFMSEIAQICSDREALISKTSEIETARRELRAKLRKISSETPECGGMRGYPRHTRIRRIQARIAVLTTQAEFVRAKLADIKRKKKAMGRATHSRNSGFAEAFLAACEINLPEEKFLELETQAYTILEAY